MSKACGRHTETISYKFLSLCLTKILEKFAICKGFTFLEWKFIEAFLWNISMSTRPEIGRSQHWSNSEVSVCAAMLFPLTYICTICGTNRARQDSTVIL